MQYIITCIMIAMDYLTGLAQAIYNHNFQSCVMREGIFHKLAIIGVLLLVAVVEWSMGYIDLGVLGSFPTSGMVCSGFVIMEIGSTLENLHKINKDIPSGYNGLFSIGKKKEEEV